MTTLREAAQMAYAVPLHELLAAVPRDARLVIEDADGKGTRFIPVGRYCHEAAEALRAALAADKPSADRLAQPEQEPTRSQKMRDAGITRRPKGWDKEQELEGINEVILNSIRDSSEVVAPPQREWQGLTDEEMFNLWVKCPAETEDRFAFARAIEQALREKNT